MLNELRTYVVYHLQAAMNSLNYLCRQPLVTIMTVVVIAIALTLPALFWVFTDNLGQLTTDWQRGGRISLYLKSSLSSMETELFLHQVRQISGVEQAVLKTREEGLAELQQQEGMQDIMHYLPENPLPAMIDIIPSVTINTPLQIKLLFEQLKVLSQVEQAKLDMEWITKLYAVLRFVTKISHTLMILLAFVVTLIIGNTLRLAIHTRLEEIRILKLIGATDSFILRPFLYSGIWYGMLGSIFTVLFVNLFMLSIGFAAQELASVYQMHYNLSGLTVKQAYLIVLVAVFLGWLGARLSVKKQLTFIEPYH